MSVEEKYKNELDIRLQSLVREPQTPFIKILRQCHGAFPTVVDERLNALGLSEFVSFEENKPGEEYRTKFSPELHPLDFEWYFNSTCIQKIADTICEEQGEVLCLGTPTVAAEIASRGHSVTLVDRSSHFQQRLALDNKNIMYIKSDIRYPLSLSKDYPIVFFDPPWYPKATKAWLKRSIQYVSDDGKIYFSLFPDLVRPTAQIEREEIFSWISRIGDWEIKTDYLSYMTPRFEKEALKANNLPVLHDWRRSDLVEIEPTLHENNLPDIAIDLTDNWDEFLLGDQVIKLKKNNGPQRDFLFREVEGSVNYIYPTVSKRDSRRKRIGLWTSRNRVAEIGDRRQLAQILRELEYFSENQSISSFFQQNSYDLEAWDVTEEDMKKLLDSTP